eukprot:gene25477-biopygen16502
MPARGRVARAASFLRAVDFPAFCSSFLLRATRYCTAPTELICVAVTAGPDRAHCRTAPRLWPPCKATTATPLATFISVLIQHIACVLLLEIVFPSVLHLHRTTSTVCAHLYDPPRDCRVSRRGCVRMSLCHTRQGPAGAGISVGLTRLPTRFRPGFASKMLQKVSKLSPQPNAVGAVGDQRAPVSPS